MTIQQNEFSQSVKETLY